MNADQQRPLGDAGDDDLELHRGISSQERVDAILNAPHMTPQQAADALTAHMVESQGRYPHAVVATVMAAKEWGSDEKVPVSEHVGLFPDRRAAEAWATSHYADKPAVTWQTVQVRRPEWVEEDVERIRKIVEDD
jgi:hypothetical protein